MIESQNYNLLNQRRRRLLRENYVIEQKCLCYYCNAHLFGSPNQNVLAMDINWNLFPGGRNGFLRYPIHLHHDHNTGMTIGAVHAYCNAVLWQYHKE